MVPHHSGRAYAVFLLLLTLFVNSCETEITDPEPISPVAHASGQLATDWFELQLKLIQTTPGFSPPVASRALGYSGVTLYESVVQGTIKYESLTGQLNEMPAMPKIESGKEYNWQIVANAAMATITNSLYATAKPEMKIAIDSLENVALVRAGVGVSDEVKSRSIAFGESIANKIFEWSMTDGGHEGYTRNFPTDFEIPVGEGLWVPTSAAQPRPLQPYWGNNRPFVLPKGTPNAETGVVAPPTWSSEAGSAMHTEALEVYSTVKGLSEAQRATALFWADDAGRTCTPPGHSVSILCQCMDAEQKNLEDCAIGFAKLGMAVSDAFIACWDTKFEYNLIRPVSYIGLYIDTTWNDADQPVATPPFPEYTSGHSVQSGAMAEVMSGLMGSNFQFTDNTHSALGYPARTFASFEVAAQEAAISRLYGGIHYRVAIEKGLQQGKQVGQKVNAVKFEK